MSFYDLYTNGNHQKNRKGNRNNRGDRRAVAYSATIFLYRTILRDPVSVKLEYYITFQESSDDEETTQLIRARQEKAATLARAAVSQIAAKPMGRHNSTPGLSKEKASHSDGENYVPFKQRSGASTGALLGYLFNY